jgi:hypothetical protein
VREIFSRFFSQYGAVIKSLSGSLPPQRALLPPATCSQIAPVADRCLHPANQYPSPKTPPLAARACPWENKELRIVLHFPLDMSVLLPIGDIV